jgi:23S rRNA (cytidine1920-2'-O)/16S rRNA (cytidine1409-2'-O)-methyltransferase
MSRRARVDVELVRRGLARSRQQAAELIDAGKVRIDGLPAVKPGTAVAVTAALTVADDGERTWVSRGAHKLIGALEAFGIPVEGRRCLDAGASTGGFTEVLLDRGAAEVVAADVGYGQLAWSLRCDPRVAGRPTWWWLTCRSSRWPPCCRRWLAVLRPTRISFPW